MKSTRRRALYVIAALLGALFVLSCLVGFAACGGGNNDEDDATVSTVSISGATSVEEGKTVTLTASVTMSDNSPYTGSYTWSSTGSAVTLSSSTTNTVTVTGVTAGSSDITVTAGGVTSAKYTVTVTAAQQQQPTVQSVSITPTSSSLNLYESNTATLTATVTMDNGNTSTSETVNWSSPDASVATLSATTGYSVTLTAVGAGTTSITASVGSVTSSACSVTVTADTVKTAAGLSDALASGGSVSLTDNITLTDSSSALEVKKDATIDLAGKTISTDTNWTGSSAYYEPEALITVDSGATLTVTDSGTGTTSGSISYTYTTADQATNSSNNKTADWNSSAYYGAAIEVAEGGSLVVEGGTISSSSVGVRAEGVTSESEGRATVTINGGTISSTYFSIWASGDADVTIEEGATVSGTNKGICIGGDSNFGYSTYQSNTATTLTINGGEISCTNDSAITTLGVGSNESAVITINGGTITSSATLVIDDETDAVKTTYPAIYLPTGTLKITAGTITGITAVEVRGGIVDISGGELVTSYFDSEEDETSTENDTDTEAETKTAGVISNSSGATSFGYSLAIYPYGGTSRTGYQASDNAVNVTVTAGIFEGDIYVAAEAAYAVSGSSSKWQVDFDGTTATEDSPSYYIVSINESLGFTKKAYSSANTPVCESSSDISYYVFSATVTFAADESALTQALTSGGEIVLTDDITLSGTTTGGDTATALTVSADSEIDLAGKSISTAETLSSAMNTIEVSENATLTIIDSTGEGAIKNTYAGGTNGNTSLDNAAAIETKGTLVIESGTIESSSIGVKAEGGEVTIDGGTIESDYFALWEGGANVEVTINGGTLSGRDKGVVLCGDSNYGYTDENGNNQYQTNVVTTLTVNGGDISCTNDSAITTLGVGSNSSAVITINGGTITSEAKVVTDDSTGKTTSCPAIYLPTGTLTITGGTISGATAVEVRGGTVKISGGALVSISEVTGVYTNSSGATTYGYSLAINPYGKTSRTNYQASDNAVDVSVSGGTFTGDIYVAAESSYAASGESKWQVSFEKATEGDDNGDTQYYVVVFDVSLSITKTAYDSNGEVVQDSTEGDQGDTGSEQTVSYYIVKVSAVSN